MNVSVRRRARQRAQIMQAELDGRGQAIATPAFIAPAQLKPAFHMSGESKPAFHMSDEPPFWFAVWNVRYNVAYALDAYPDELIPYERALQSARREVGDHFAGPFSSEQQAQTVAVEQLTAGRTRARHGGAKRGASRGQTTYDPTRC
jgi:hypothetical protein